MLDFNHMTEAEQIDAVQTVANCVAFIENPSEAVQMAAVMKSAQSIRHIKNPTMPVCVLAKLFA